MRKHKADFMKRTLLAFSLAGVMTPAALADDAFEIDGYVGVTNDLRDRGISLSNKDIALTGSLSFFHDSGIYGGVDVTSVDTSRFPLSVNGDARSEYFVGYSLDAGDYIYDVSVELDGIYGDKTDYYPEFKARVARDFGLAYIRGGLAFAPEGRWNTPGVDSWYTYADMEIPIPTLSDFTILTHMGYDMRQGRSNLLDWSTGLSMFISEHLELTLQYEDSSLDNPAAKGRVTFGTRFYF